MTDEVEELASKKDRALLYNLKGKVLQAENKTSRRRSVTSDVYEG